MPVKLGNGGKGPEAYNQYDGKYTDEGNISQEERKAMNFFGVKDNQQVQENNENKIPWDWRNISIDDFNVSGLEKERLDNLLYDYKRFMYDIEQRQKNPNSSITPKELKEYQRVKEIFEKYIPKFNKEQYQASDNIYSFGIGKEQEMKQDERIKNELSEAVKKYFNLGGN